MSEPFLAEIKIVGFNFAPRGWAYCDGQILPISQNQALYSLLGTTYGGDGRVNFALPDLRGRTPIHKSIDYSQGQSGGAESIALSNDELPSHKHQLSGVTDPATTGIPNGAYWANNVGLPYGTPVPGNEMADDTLVDTGGGQGHNNMQPFLTLGLYRNAGIVSLTKLGETDMSEPFVGEIRMFAGNFAPRSWAFCDGQLLAISQNDALFSLFGTIYGGDGRNTFGLPDLRGRIPLHQGAGPGLSSRNLGTKGGQEQETLTVNELPSHNHSLIVSDQIGNQQTPTGQTLAKISSGNLYKTPATVATKPAMAAAIGNTGGSISHNNLMPSLCVNFIVSLFGIYPSRN